MLKFKYLTIILVGLLLSTTTLAIPAKLISETVELAAKESGKILSPVAQEMTEKSLLKSISLYGDNVLKNVKVGGLEALEQGSKYGDNFWRLCDNASPTAIRSLAMNADELMPLAQKLGKEFLELEGKVPGLGSRVVATFGDESVAILSKAPADDISKLLGYAGKADKPETVKALYSAYRGGGSEFLSNLNWKHIMSTGLSTATIVAAYKVSDGVQDGIIAISENDPESAVKLISSISRPIILLFIVLLILIFPQPLLYLVKRLKSKLNKEKRGVI